MISNKEFQVWGQHVPLKLLFKTYKFNSILVDFDSIENNIDININVKKSSPKPGTKYDSLISVAIS